MMKRVAAWVIASAASLAGHLVLLAFVSSLAGGTASPPLAELRISEDSGFAVTAVPEVQSQTPLQANQRDTQATQPVSATAKSALAPLSSANANAGVVAEESRLKPVAAEQASQPAQAEQLSPASQPDAIAAITPDAALSQPVREDPQLPVQDSVPVILAAPATPATVTNVAPSTSAEAAPVPAAKPAVVAPKQSGVAPTTAGIVKLVQPVQNQSTAPPPETVEPVVSAEQQVALAPATIVPVSLAEKMRSFVRGYRGGSCFFAMPVSVEGEDMRIDGFGSEVGPILAFGTELRRAFGSKAAVEVRQITSRQCPAIGLIGRLLKSRTPELHVMLDAQSVNSGGELHGDVDGVRHPWLSLLLVDDDGKIHDISSYLRKSNDSWSFTVKVFLTAEGKGRNQLIVAVASQQELEQFSSGEQAASLDSFADVVAKAAASESDIAIGLSAFRVE